MEVQKEIVRYFDTEIWSSLPKRSKQLTFPRLEILSFVIDAGIFEHQDDGTLNKFAQYPKVRHEQSHKAVVK